MGSLNELPIYLDDMGALTVSEVRSRCRRLKSAEGLSAIFIDYLQLVRPGVLARNVNRNEELSDICRTFKVTAKDLGVPIIALAQLNRGVEMRSDKRPMLSDLRDSGSLEQEADVVAFLYREGYYNAETSGAGPHRVHHRQTPQRADRHRKAALPARVHALSPVRRRVALRQPLKAPQRIARLGA